MAGKTKTLEGFSRCAVCKIDLKGRFVYVDERIEQLFGKSKDELFGRAITSFVDDNTSALINNLLEERNHYETYFDYARFRIVDCHGNPVEASAIVSLNFIAGNPVNFQLVFKLDRTRADADSPSPDTGFRELLVGLIRSDGLSDMKEFLRTLVNCCGARAAYAYQLEQGQLIPRSGAQLLADGGFTFDSIPAPTYLHSKVGQTGQAYRYIDQSHSASSLAEFGEAPTELITRVSVGDIPRYVIRLEFAEHTQVADAQAAIEKAELAIGLAGRIGEPSQTISGDDPQVDVKFTVGFLDNIGIGAILTSASGEITGYNSVAGKLLDGRRPDGHISSLLDQIIQDGSQSITEDVAAFFLDPDPQQSELEREVLLPSGVTAYLTVVRLSLDKGDQTAFYIFQPYDEKLSG